MRGQAISSDFVFSLIIFAAASILAFTMISNSLIDREHEAVVRQAEIAASLLNSEGFPQHWSSSDVLRAGLRSGDQLSLRKADELASLDSAQLKRALRTTDQAYVYLTNRTNHVVPAFGKCGLGDLSVNSTPSNRTLPSVAIISGSHPVADIAGAQQRNDDLLYANLSAQDVIIIEGNISSNLSGAQIKLALEQAAARGITFIIIGDPGIPFFGIDINASPGAGTILETGFFGLDAGNALDIPGTIATIDEPSGNTISDFTVIAAASKPVYATWIFDDSRIWYFATSEGTGPDGTPLAQLIGNTTRSTIERYWPVCDNPAVDGAQQVAMHTRSIPYHDELLDIHVIVWRDG